MPPLRSLLAVAVAACVSCTSRAPARTNSPPNIVVFLADDLGIGEVGAYGQRELRTPHIDRLAREGVRFTDFRSSAPLCGAAR